MEFTLILAPLVAALIAGPLSKPLGEQVATYSALSFAVFAAVLSWFMALSYTGEVRSVLLGRWIESGTLATEISLRADGISLAFAVLVTTTAALLQVHGLTLPTPKAHRKLGDSSRMRLQEAASFLTFGLLLVAFSSGTVMLVAALFVLGLAVYVAVDFNYRSKGAGQAAARALLVWLAGTMALLVVAAVLYASTDAGEFDVLMPLADDVMTSNDAIPLVILFGFAVLLWTAALPAFPWSVDSGDGPPQLAALTQTLVGGAAVIVLLKMAPFVGHEIAIPAALALITALVGALAALAQRDLRRALGSAALVPLMLTLLVALAGDGELAFVMLAFHAISHALLWLGYGSLMRRLRGEAEIAAMGGLRDGHRAAHFSVFFATLAATGFGFPFVYGNEGPIALPGFVLQVEILARADGFSGWLFWGVLSALSIYAFALWRVYVRVFQGSSRARKRTSQKPIERAPEPGLSRFVMVLLAVVLVGSGWLVAEAIGWRQAPKIGWREAAPMFICVGSALIAGLLGLLPQANDRVTSAFASVSELVSSHFGVLSFYERVIGGPVQAIGGWFAKAGVWDAPFSAVTAWLLPKLERGSNQARQTSAFPYFLGGVVLAALVVTLVTMAGG